MGRIWVGPQPTRVETDSLNHERWWFPKSTKAGYINTCTSSCYNCLLQKISHFTWDVSLLLCLPCSNLLTCPPPSPSLLPLPLTLWASSFLPCPHSINPTKPHANKPWVAATNPTNFSHLWRFHASSILQLHHSHQDITNFWRLHRWSFCNLQYYRR